jgi:flagellar hook-length control protein FliK
MIRRLHFQEVQPPANAVTPIGKAADNENHDSLERSALALEFEHLLATLGNGVAALSDGASALGLALAQTGPAARAVPQDHQKSEIDTDAGDDTGLDLYLDDQGSDEGPTVQIEDREVDADADAGGSEVEESEQQGPDMLADDSLGGDVVQQIVAMDIADVQVHVERQVVAQDVSTGAEDSQEREAQAGLEESVLAEKQGPTQLESLNTEAADTTVTQRQTQVSQEVQTRIKVESHKKEKDEGDELVAAAATTTSDMGDFEGARRVRAEGAKDVRDEGGSQLLNNPQHGGVSVESAAVSEGARQRSHSSDEARALLSEMMQSHSNEGLHKVARASGDEQPAPTPEISASPIARPAGRLSENGVQMALLRQAFESLKQARQESSEARQRTATPTVGAAGATSEPRRAEGEASSRSARSMTRPQTARMMERVEGALKEAAKSRDGKTISLRLDPADFGRVKVDVSLREGALHARLTPENQQVMVALRENAHELHGALRKLGLDVSSVTVSVSAEKGQDDAGTGTQMQSGSSFQDERNNMPHERGQVAENTFGNELADWKKVGTPEQATSVVDHWVA